MVYANTTSVYALGSMGSLAGWLPICLMLMAGIFIVSFLIYKTIRWSLIGAGISGIGFIVFKICEYISKQNASGNTVPLDWFLYIIGFIVVSVIVGQVLRLTSWGKKLDVWLEKDNEEDKQSNLEEAYQNKESNLDFVNIQLKKNKRKAKQEKN